MAEDSVRESAMNATRRRSPDNEAPAQVPQSLPQSVPGYGAGGDHSFTLQAIMELQRSAGEITQALRSLEKTVGKFDTRLDGAEAKLSGVTHKIYAAGAVLTILVGVGAFIVDKAWDVMVKGITEQSQASNSSTAPKNANAGAPQER